MSERKLPWGEGDSAIQQVRDYVEGHQTRLVDKAELIRVLGITRIQAKCALRSLVLNGDLRLVNHTLGQYEIYGWEFRQEPTSAGIALERKIRESYVKDSVRLQARLDFHNYREGWVGLEIESD